MIGNYVVRVSKVAILIFILRGGLWGQLTKENEIRRGAEDFLQTVSPLVYGGILESGSPYGGFPHFSIGLALNMVGKIDFINPVDTTSMLSFPGVFPFLIADIGLFSGFSAAPLIDGIGAIDILFRYIRAPNPNEAQITKVPSFLSYGVRIGILKDGLTTPGASLTWKHGRLGTLKVEPEDLQELEWAELDMKTNSVFLEVSKSLIFITPYIGIGRDWYAIDARYKELGQAEKAVEPQIKGSSGRTVIGVKLSLLLLKLYAEIGKYGNKTIVSAGFRAGI